MSEVYGAVLEFLQDRFKGRLSHDELEYTVGTDGIVVAGGDAERVSLTLVNLGATTLYLSPSLQVSTVHGLRLGAQGGTVTMNVEEDSLLPALGWWCVSSAGGGLLFVLTVFRSSKHEPGE